MLAFHQEHTEEMNSISPVRVTNAEHWFMQANERIIIYRNTRENQNIRIIKLVQDGEDFNVSILVKPDAYDRLACMLIHLGFMSRATSIDKLFNQITFNASSMESLKSKLQIVKRMDPDLRIIFDEIIKLPSLESYSLPRSIFFSNEISRTFNFSAPRSIYHLEFSRFETRLFERPQTFIHNQDRIGEGPIYRPSIAPSPVMPDSGVNAKALEDLEIDIPERLTCPLSQQIMTDPVYPEGLDNKQCFERSWLVNHINRGGNHPITRESLVGKNLLVDETLKKECDDFVAKCLNKNVEPVPLVTIPQPNTNIEITRKRRHCVMM